MPKETISFLWPSWGKPVFGKPPTIKGVRRSRWWMLGIEFRSRPEIGGKWTWQRCPFDVCGKKWLQCRLAFCNGCHVFLSSLRLNSIGFVVHVFLCAGHQIWTFHPQKSIQFLVGHFTKRQWGHGLAHESGLLFCAKVWSHLCQGFASQRHQKRSWKLIEKKQRTWEMSYKGCQTTWKLIEKITT